MKKNLLILLFPLVLLTACQTFLNQDQSNGTVESEATITPTSTVWATLPPFPMTATPVVLATLDPKGLEGKITFQSDRDGNLDIYVYDFQNESLSKATTNENVDVFPSWSSDGKQIVFVSDRDGNPEIYIMNKNGSGLKRLMKYS